ncbi:isoleucine--tRNA ligase [Caldiplasma sukawensis]
MNSNFELINTERKLKDQFEFINEYWENNNIPEKAMKKNSGKEKFIFLEGPPTANGLPHVGHALTRTVKDTVLRYKTMKGYDVTGRNAGWDCHGLPVELEAEKKLGLKSKKDIVDFGIEKFNQYCRESVFQYIDQWLKMDKKIGFWIDHENAYITMRNEYIESEWWALKNMFLNATLYKDFRISPYCPRCGTTLSSHELAQGYKDVKDLSVYAKFRIENENASFLAWTTTPWTLPSNMFLCVNENYDYTYVEFNGENYVVADALVGKIFQKNYRKLKTIKGKELLNKKYTRPVNFIPLPENSGFVVHGDHVNLQEGTGIVHTAPAFGQDDFTTGKKYTKDMINPVDLTGKFNDSRLPWNGIFVKDADVEIVKYLKENNLALRSERFEHSYPFCYRCDTPLLYYPIDAWFIRTSAFTKPLIDNNEKVNWVPDHLKHGRFGNFIEDVKDWNLSRNRYWGTPLPIWTCSNGHMQAVGSIEELEKLSGSKAPSDIHRPYIDEIRIRCSECGNQMEREPYVIDTWFDSGSANYASVHYPFKNVQPNVPVSFITEAIDQTRGWFYVQHAVSTILFNKNAYDNVFCVEFILDENGKKMSKSKGNGVLALDLLDQFGADQVRLFFFSSPPWKPKPLLTRIIREKESKILLTLINVYNFFANNANLDNFERKYSSSTKNRLDKWIMSSLNTLIEKCTSNMDRYEIHEAERDIEEFIYKLSNFYLRLSRRRFWDENTDKRDKEDGYAVLYTVLTTVCKLLAPIAPFTSELLYMKLTNDGTSVHLQDYPISDENLINKEIEIEIDLEEQILETTRRLRQENNVKGRQPVKEILIYSEKRINVNDIKDELNARTVRFISKEERPLKISIIPSIPKAAPVLKNRIPDFIRFIDEINKEGKQVELISKNMKFGDMEVSDEWYEIIEENLKGYVSQKEKDFQIFINLEMDSDLELEGITRDIIRRIQVMRKDMNLEYYEEVETEISGDDKIIESVIKYEDKIKRETLSRKISTGILSDEKKDGKMWEIEDHRVLICLRRIKESAPNP